MTPVQNRRGVAVLPVRRSHPMNIYVFWDHESGVGYGFESEERYVEVLATAVKSTYPKFPGAVKMLEGTPRDLEKYVRVPW